MQAHVLLERQRENKSVREGERESREVGVGGGCGLGGGICEPVLYTC